MGVGDTERLGSWTGFRREAKVLALLVAVLVSCQSAAVPDSEPQLGSALAVSESSSQLPTASSNAEAALVDSQLDTRAPFSKSVPLGAPFFSGSVEHLTYIAECLEYEGFAVTLSTDPLFIQLKGPYTAAYEDTSDRCYQMPIQEGWVVPSPFGGEGDFGLMYDLWLGTQACLIEHGYPTVEPPSREAFVDSGGTAWHPYAAFPTPGRLIVVEPQSANVEEREQLAAQELCPSYLPTLLQALARDK